MKQRRVRALGGVQERARELRKDMTPAEALLWEKLRGRRLGGLKFRRQHPVGPFIADFYCAALRLVVELDGEVHAAQLDQDRARAEQFNQYGYRVIRFDNRAVIEGIGQVLADILQAAAAFR